MASGRLWWEAESLQKSADNQIDSMELCKFPGSFYVAHKQHRVRGTPKEEKDPKLIQIKNDLSRINFDGKKSSH
jgi:hypothetical protein